MAGLKKKRRIQLIIAGFVFLACSTAIVGYAMRDGIQFFRTPSEVAEAPPSARETFRLGGLVVEGSILTSGETTNFEVTDGDQSMRVEYTGILPDLFSENQGTIATGKLVDGVFVASEVLAKHDETYMPKEVADSLKEKGYYKPEN